ncbi:Uncharacterised protein [Mycobacteroides abscessus subsp. abscessus]|nr:Uncharacterised protein [Mycobacteroides abscessus subsp. abscessus]
MMARPATTARIVAKATAAMMPISREPPSSKASSGAAEFTPPGASWMRCAPIIAAAPYPRTRVNR